MQIQELAERKDDASTDPSDDPEPFEGSCGCDGDLFPCFACYRSGRRALPRVRRVA